MATQWSAARADYMAIGGVGNLETFYTGDFATQIGNVVADGGVVDGATGYYDTAFRLSPAGAAADGNTGIGWANNSFDHLSPNYGGGDANCAVLFSNGDIYYNGVQTSLGGSYAFTAGDTVRCRATRSIGGNQHLQWSINGGAYSAVFDASGLGTGEWRPEATAYTTLFYGTANFTGLTAAAAASFIPPRRYAANVNLLR